MRLHPGRAPWGKPHEGNKWNGGRGTPKSAGRWRRRPRARPFCAAEMRPAAPCDCGAGSFGRDTGRLVKAHRVIKMKPC